MTWQEVNKKRIPHIKYGERLYLKMYREFSAALKQRLTRVERPEHIISLIENFDPNVNIKEYYVKFYVRTGMAFAKNTARNLKRRKDLNSDIQESIWLEKVLKYVEDNAGFKISQVYWNHLQDITQIARDAVNVGINEGWGIDKIVDTLFTEVSDREKWKAMRIARTEVVSASNFGAYQAAADSELDLEKIWLHPGHPGPSGYSRDEHEMMDGVAVPMNEDFMLPDGTMMPYPGDGPPEHTINCRCTVAFQPRGGGIVAQELGEI